MRLYQRTDLCASDLDLPAVARRWRRRKFRRSHPDRSTVELDCHAVGRIDRALICLNDPKASGIIDPGPGRQARVIEQVDLPSVLRDECKTAGAAEAKRDALISAVQVDSLNLRRRIGCV